MFVLVPECFLQEPFLCGQSFEFSAWGSRPDIVQLRFLFTCYKVQGTVPDVWEDVKSSFTAVLFQHSHQGFALVLEDIDEIPQNRGMKCWCNDPPMFPPHLTCTKAIIWMLCCGISLQDNLSLYVPDELRSPCPKMSSRNLYNRFLSISLLLVSTISRSSGLLTLTIRFGPSHTLATPLYFFISPHK